MAPAAQAGHRVLTSGDHGGLAGQPVPKLARRYRLLVRRPRITCGPTRGASTSGRTQRGIHAQSMARRRARAGAAADCGRVEQIRRRTAGHDSDPARSARRCGPRLEWARRRRHRRSPPVLGTGSFEAKLWDGTAPLPGSPDRHGRLSGGQWPRGRPALTPGRIVTALLQYRQRMARSARLGRHSSATHFQSRELDRHDHRRDHDIGRGCFPTQRTATAVRRLEYVQTPGPPAKRHSRRDAAAAGLWAIALGYRRRLSGGSVANGVRHHLRGVRTPPVARSIDPSRWIAPRPGGVRRSPYPPSDRRRVDASGRP